MNYWKIGAFVLWTMIVFAVGFEWRDRSCDLAVAKDEANAARATVQAHVDVRHAERIQAESMAKIGEEHEQDRREAEAVPDAVVAELRAGTLRLRNDLATCHTARLSEAAASASQRDENAQLRAEIAGDLVRVGRDADDQIRACQAVVAADRAEVIP